MLKELYIANYKSIKDTTIEFKDGLNIIIGKNGAGKSNLLAFIYLFFRREYLLSIRPIISTKRNSQLTDFKCTFYNTDEVGAYKIQIIVNKNKNEREKGESLIRSEINKFYLDESQKEHNFSYSFPNSSDGKIEKKAKEAVRLIQLTELYPKTYIQYSFSHELSWLELPKSFSLDSELNIEIDYTLTDFNLIADLEFHFENSSLLFNHKNDTENQNINERIKEYLYLTFNDFISELKINTTLANYSTIEEIRLNPNINIYQIEDKTLIENVIIEFKIGEYWVPWSYLSDGTKRLFYLITNLCSRNKGLVLIEEPELGIHPHQLFNLMTLIKEQSQNKQIVLSTHSPIVLDILQEDELDRIIIANIRDNTSSFNHLSEEKIEKAKTYMRDAELSYYWQHSDLEND